ncbi:uncharacterized protein Pyn_35107 [Prunus yedoensis var. nudiflora]|uniref:Late embryogenesis abundant protein LEA-2 subgroup domain-containing protein n=1 Tax=Prunus yedoensis var. nudiflora TaxID=2094558 RepID=A0A314ZS80_PRUYE|nr:uncharacterized protein Pyn_35107 [Prunus yedoensis var. nudiflora]
MATSTTAAETTPIHRPICDTRSIACLPYFFIFLIALTSLASVRPRAFCPYFRVDSAALQYTHINATRSSSDLTATWDVTLIAANPNVKWDIYCDIFQPAVLYYNPIGLRLASTSLRPLLLKSSNQTSVSFKLPMQGTYIPDDVAKEISDDNTTTLPLKFGLMISVQCSYRAHLSKKRTPHSIVRDYFCNPIQVRVFSNDTNNNNNSHINEGGSLTGTTDYQPTACAIPRW